MNLKPSKIKTYIGFAIKSNKIKYGVDDIIKSNKTSLILFSDLLAESSCKKLQNFAEKTNSKVIKVSSNEFLELFDENYNIKAVAILDNNLANAINKEMTK